MTRHFLRLAVSAVHVAACCALVVGCSGEAGRPAPNGAGGFASNSRTGGLGGSPSGGSAGAATTSGGASGSHGGAPTNAVGAPGDGGAATAGSGAAGTGGATSGTAGASATGGDSGSSSGGLPSASAGTANGGTSLGGSASGGTGGAGAFTGKELFILFGQSNMSGMSPMPEAPWPINPNVTFMVQYDCPSLGQTKDEWLPAQPPLHGCQWATGGIGLGLADHFGAALAAAWPNAKIGLIPNAIPAVTIEIFTKGGPSPGGGMKALPDGYTSAYTLMVDRVKEAQKLGRVRAILMHQGESDYNQGLSEQWLGKLATVVADLRADLGLTESVPFIAGEISPASSYSGHNVYVDRIPDSIPNSAVVSAEGTKIHDVAHFDGPSAKLMGERYAQTFLALVPPQ